jgi:DNA-binding NarL/FixJ family response regulator
VANGAEPSPGRPIGVLICDDVDEIRELLRAAVGLAPALLVLGEAADGNAAVAQAVELHPDVILLDLAMPVRSGLDALPELRRVVPDAKIIVLSGITSDIVEDRVLALGAAHYLQKGADPETITDAIVRVVRHPAAAA